MHTLDENVRQGDPAERAPLVELRSGDVGTALAFYADHDRIRPSATRDDGLDAMVEDWAGDVEAGTDTAMFAWRRANVAELNARGRHAMAGRLSGPELVVGGRGFQAGDRIVTLATRGGRRGGDQRARAAAGPPGGRHRPPRPPARTRGRTGAGRRVGPAPARPRYPPGPEPPRHDLGMGLGM